MSKKVWAVLILIFLIIFGLNALTPLMYGDDYVYSFIWTGQSIYLPLPETVERISGFSDIFVSQWKHYFTWGGRAPAHLLAQLFLWQDKQLFNFFNSIVFVLLVLEIYWISNRGKVTLININLLTLYMIFFIIWSFTVNFAGVFLWVTGACNYLWMLVLLLSFLILYVRKYYGLNISNTHPDLTKYLAVVWGIAAGWTNENTVCWLILVLGMWLFKNRKKADMEKWLWYGLAGLCIGYMLLLLAPGNIKRADYYVDISIWSWLPMRSKLITLCVLEFLQIFLWYFVFSAWRKIRVANLTKKGLQHLVLVKICCILNLLSNGIMLFTPEFPARSGFSALIFLTIAVTLLICNQADFNVKLIDDFTKKCIVTLAGCYFLITLYGTYAGMYSTYRYNQNVIKTAQKHQAIGLSSVLEVPAPPAFSETLVWMSGRHIVQPSLKEDEMDWINVAFARYYGIKGIRIKKSLNH